MQSVRVATRAYVLENGRIAVSGRGAELAGNPELEKAYLGM
jgi:branched-chain amino acid transport system ATP-binding protein